VEGFGVTSAFWALGALAVGSALGIMLARSLLHAVLWLILSFIALAGLFVTLSADFVAVAQVLVYAGAVGVLVIFAIMLTPGTSTANTETRLFGPGFVVAAVLSAIMVYVAAHTSWPAVADAPGAGLSAVLGAGGTAQAIGEALVGRYVLPFEIASVVLIAALVGALVLVRGDGAARTPEPAEETEDAERREVVPTAR
jgi:NADH:ubiquinone oxidoreductase subunit 6 (subunit J)